MSRDLPGVDGAGQIVHHHVEQHLDAAVLEGGSSGHRHQLSGNGRLAQSGAQSFGIGGLLFEEKLHHLVVAAGHRLVEFLKGLLTLGGQVSGKLLFGDGHALILGIEIEGLAPDHVDHAAEVPFLADGQRDADRVRTQLAPDLADDPVEIGARAVHLVDQGDDGHMIFLGLTPDRLGLGLNFAHGAEDRHGAVQDPQGALHLGGEVHVSGSVDDVDLAAFPMAGDGGGGDGDAPLPLLLHPVGGGSALMGVPQLVVDAGIKKDPFGQGRLAGVDVSHDTDVAHILERDGAVGRLMEIFLVSTHKTSFTKAKTVPSENHQRKWAKALLA